MSKRIFTSAGVIQRENSISASASGSATAASSATSRTPRDAAVLVGVDRAAGEHPRPAHEPLLGVALDEQDLERVAAAAQHDHGGGLAGRRGGAGVQLLARSRFVDPHGRATLLSTHDTRAQPRSGSASPAGSSTTLLKAIPTAASRRERRSRRSPPTGSALSAGPARPISASTRTEPERGPRRAPGAPAPAARAARLRRRQLDARRRDRCRAPDGAVLRRLDDRVGEHDRGRARRAVDRLLVRRPDGRPPPRPCGALCLLVLVAVGAARARPDRRAAVPLAQRRARSTTSRSAPASARCSACSRSSRSRC